MRDLKPLKCGGCGNLAVKLYIDGFNQIVSECTLCKSTTEFVIPKPEIDLKFGDGSKGIMCVY